MKIAMMSTPQLREAVEDEAATSDVLMDDAIKSSAKKAHDGAPPESAPPVSAADPAALVAMYGPPSGWDVEVLEKLTREQKDAVLAYWRDLPDEEKAKAEAAWAKGGR